MSGMTFQEILKRPSLTTGDAEALEQLPSVLMTDIFLGGGIETRQERVYYRNQRTAPVVVIATTERWPYINQFQLDSGRFFTALEVQRRQQVAVVGQTVKTSLFPNTDPIGKQVRIGLAPYTIVGVMAPRPSLGFDVGADAFVVIPHTTYQKRYGVRISQMTRGRISGVMISVLPREGVPREQALRDVEQLMRVRHGLRLDQANDFDLVTSDAMVELFEQVSQAFFLALVVLSSIALMVGGIGVMSIMTISVTERTREIGVRKALGARRIEVLWQFLLEACFLTSVGGLLGIVIGSGVGLLVHWFTGFPISLPWWSFAIGIGFSAGVGIFFGMVPAVRASRLDPIEALRYE
jgi:putative ABC transport system permease protein